MHDKQRNAAPYPVAVSNLSKPPTLWIERAILVLSMLFFCIHILPKAWKTLNTDFPNYYLAARLAHEGYDTSRMYEWSWFEREKDHRAIDDRVIGLLPITPFSTLILWPLAFFAPLTAKHLWILLNLAFLIPMGWLLNKLTGLPCRTIGLAIFLSFPLYRNFLYGQFYIFLLLLILAACFSYWKGWQAIAGVLIAIAAACKIFPLVFFLFFLRRSAWRAMAATFIAGGCAVALSIAVFGLNAHLTWLNQILPWVMHGEGLGTYSTNASITGVLHCLFLPEPQWNPHPWHDSPMAYAVLAPMLSMILVAPSILLMRREEAGHRILLEWSALLTAALAVSTIPASYNFVLMIFPVCVLASILLGERRYGWLSALILAYLGIGFPLPVPEHPQGLTLLLYIPRLPLMIAVLLGIYILLWRDSRKDRLRSSWMNYAWAAAMMLYVLLGIRSTLHLEQGERREYAYRIPVETAAFLYAGPASEEGKMQAAAFTLDGYRLITMTPGGRQEARTGRAPDNISEDILSFSANRDHMLSEHARAGQSEIVDQHDGSHVLVKEARDPMLPRDPTLSHDQEAFAFLRDDHGRGRLILRRSFVPDADEISLTPSTLNVYEGSFLREKEYAFSAAANGAAPRIFLTDSTHHNSPILQNSRYPALSPDGRWLAYSHLEHGAWNLWIRDENTGAIRRIADVPCNEIQPSWEEDSKTLLYGSDCGRSVWFTAIARRRVIP